MAVTNLSQENNYMMSLMSPSSDRPSKWMAVGPVTSSEEMLTQISAHTYMVEL